MYKYLDYIPTVQQRHRKFVDEASYSERDLIAKKGCKSRPGDRIVLGDLALHEQNDAFYSVTFLASMTHPKGGALLSIRQGTNKATHFGDAILGAVHAGHLLAGDRLILDNAGIHRTKKVIPALRVILSAVGVELDICPNTLRSTMPPNLHSIGPRAISSKTLPENLFWQELRMLLQRK
eukprot:g56256.t1